MKAYDSVDWNFLVGIMQSMEFPMIYINWVKACVTTPKFSVLINGELRDYFTGKRGLRQGDPISPYLFLLIIEAFAALLHFRISLGSFSYHPRCEAINLSHLIFADDMFIVCGANPQTFTTIIVFWRTSTSSQACSQT